MSTRNSFQSKLKSQLKSQPKSQLHGRALITGGSSGIGLSFAKALAQRGLDLVLVARDEQRLERTAQELSAQYGVQCDYFSADLAQREGVLKVKSRLVQDDDPIDVFINNAGAGLYSKLATQDYTEILNGLQVMGAAPMELGGAAADAMRSRGGGVIISTSSVAALAPMGAYSAIKEMLRVWSDSLAIELSDSPVQVLTFVLGWSRTEFHQRTGVSNDSIPSWIWTDPDEVVAEALQAVERRATSVVPTTKFKAVSFLAKHLPASVVRVAVRKLNKGRR